VKNQLPQLLLLLTLSALGTNWLERRASQDLTGCRSNLKNLATALEMYSSDHGGRYPLTLRELRGEYLQKMPTCPVTGSDYADTYSITTRPDGFSFGCRGRHHGPPSPNHWEPDLSLGYPWYTSDTGIPDHP